MIADDGFAGAGGWDIAAARLGIEARGIENMKEARATRDAAGLITIHDDVWTFEPDGKAVGKIDSPPCQTFSAAGKGSGRKALEDVLRGIRDRYYVDRDHLRFLGLEVGDERTSLVLTPLHFATQYDYEWLAWEQVPTVLPVWEACAEVLRDKGWHAWTGLLHAEQYGVPQTRKRAFLLASRRHPITPPVPTHSRYYSRTPENLDHGVAKWVSMAEGLGWGLLNRPAYTVVGGSGGRNTNGTEWGSSAVRDALYAAQGDPRQWTLRASNHAHSAVRHATHPAPTLVFGHCSNDVRWYPAGSTHSGVAETAAGRHPDSIRVSVPEAGVLQSFPVDYPWRGTRTRQYLQVGNAIPPGLALHALATAAGIDALGVAA